MKQTRIIVLLVFALCLVMFVGLLFGSSGIGPIDAIKAIASILGFGDSPETHTRIILLMRLPRMLVSVLSGMALGLAGALSQTLFRNDLADPWRSVPAETSIHFLAATGSCPPYGRRPTVRRSVRPRPSRARQKSRRGCRRTDCSASRAF